MRDNYDMVALLDRTTGKWHFQEAPYIEDGLYIVEEGPGDYSVREISSFGGQESEEGRTASFAEAYKLMRDIQSRHT